MAHADRRSGRHGRALAAGTAGLALVLGVAVVVPLVFALGTNTPIYEPIWRWFPGPPLHPCARPADSDRRARARCASRSPPPGSSLVCRPPSTAAAAIAIALVGADLAVLPFGPTAADPGNEAYAAVSGPAQERILELPLFEPGIHYGSVYHYYALEYPRERPAATRRWPRR